MSKGQHQSALAGLGSVLLQRRWFNPSSLSVPSPFLHPPVLSSLPTSSLPSAPSLPDRHPCSAPQDSVQPHRGRRAEDRRPQKGTEGRLPGPWQSWRLYSCSSGGLESEGGQRTLSSTQSLLEGASNGAWAPFCIALFFLQKTLPGSPGVNFSVFSPQWQESNRKPFGARVPKAALSLQPPWEQSWGLGSGWLSSHSGLEWSDWGTGLGEPGHS